jgi:hypothetical protein
MISLQDNKKTLNTVLFVLGISAILLLISSLFMLTQDHKNLKQISGKIIAVNESSLIISDVRGRESTIYLNKDTEVRSKNLSLEPGVFIISFGVKDESDKFISSSIRLINKR